jgi:hypothetical protein
MSKSGVFDQYVVCCEVGAYTKLQLIVSLTYYQYTTMLFKKVSSDSV